MEYVLSIIIYAVSFGISLILCHTYQKKYSQKNYGGLLKYKKYVWLLLVISIPVLISTIRYDVGTDYLSYVQIFNRINSFTVERAVEIYGNEPLYLICNKVAFIFFKEPWGIFLISSLLIHIFTIAGLDYFKNHLSMSMGLFIFYMFHFNYGLNVMRQMIAVSIIFYSLKYIMQRKPIKYIMLVITATMFHNTAIICLAFYLIVYVMDKSYSKYNFINKIYYILIFLSPVIIPLGIKQLMKIPILNQYQKYIFPHSDIGIGFLVFLLPIFLPIFIYKKQIKKVDSLLYLLLLNFPFQIVGYYIDWGSRMALYSNVLYYVLPPIIVGSIQKRSERIMVKMYYIICFIAFYIFRFVIINNQGGYPYNIIF